MMIEDYSSGRMTVDGKEYRRDLKIIENRVRPDWWREEDHRLDTGDLTDVLSANPDVLVVGKGYAGNMRVEATLRSALQERNIELVELQTGEAVKAFNDMVSQGKSVAGAFHLTC